MMGQITAKSAHSHFDKKEPCHMRISCKGVWKVFGRNPGKIVSSDLHNKSKEEVLKETGHVIAVKDVSFEVTDGEVFVVMGLSGSGKSTLLRCLNRLIEPTAGQVFVEDVDLATIDEMTLREMRRKKISMVFQHFALFPHRCVIENVATGLEIQGIDKALREERALEVLEMVGLTGWENAYPDQLSGGMQQRVGLARALAVDPDIMLMDEPYSALDPLIRRQMQDEFINLRTMVKQTVVFITHDLLEALKLGDRVAIMKDGEIVQIGTPQEILSEPADDYVSEFVKDVPRGQVIPVESIMEPPPVLVQSEENLEAVIKGMKQKEVAVAFVIDGDGRLKGITTMERAEESAKEGVTQIGEILQTDMASVPAGTRLDDCLPLVADNDTPLAVLGEGKRLLGVVTRPALIKAMQSGNGNSNKR